MEFRFLGIGEMVFNGDSFIHEWKMQTVESVTKINYERCRWFLDPKIDGLGCDMYAEEGRGNSFGKTSIELLFGNTDLAKDLKMGSTVPVTAHLTLTSANTGKLMIESKRATLVERHIYDADLWDKPEVVNKPADIFEELLKLQENLPPNSIEFIMELGGFQKDHERILSFKEEGLKIMRNETGSACLEMTDINFPEDVWWKQWSDRRSWYYGDPSLKLRLDMVAVNELYKMRFGKVPLATEVEGGTDMVILVGGNQDKEKGIKCHKSILTGISPVFATMFETDMMEAKENILEIVDFSETCVRAMIEFAYRGNVEEALKSSEMCLELLQVAHRYEMKKLMDILVYMIWSMSCTWFSADVAIKLYFFTKNLGKDFTEAEKKSWIVLKWYAKKYPEKLIESKEGVHLCENPRAVMELIVLLLNSMK